MFDNIREREGEKKKRIELEWNGISNFWLLLFLLSPFSSILLILFMMKRRGPTESKKQIMFQFFQDLETEIYKEESTIEKKSWFNWILNHKLLAYMYFVSKSA